MHGKASRGESSKQRGNQGKRTIKAKRLVCHSLLAVCTALPLPARVLFSLEQTMLIPYTRPRSLGRPGAKFIDSTTLP